jgi:tetratricopeptide (TPR) repeat protein
MAAERGGGGPPGPIRIGTVAGQSINVGGAHASLSVRDFSNTVPAADPVPRTLPRDVEDFVGRVPELDLLLRLLAPSPSAVAPPVVAITGVGGSGKTALAVRAAHRLADQYPDGQFFVHLQTPGGTPKSPDESLQDMLRGLGLPSEALPSRLDARSALFRSLLAQRRVLLVLDDADNARQVLPLLPAAPSSAAIITSRGSLATLDGVPGISLGRLTRDEAVALLETLTKRRQDADRESFQRIAEECGDLPLALELIGALVRDRPSRSVEDVASWLTGSLQGIGILDLTAPTRLSRVFDLVYRRLEEEPARAFRLLASAPGDTFGLDAAEVLLGATPRDARALLRDLRIHGLVSTQSRNRYRYHPLLRDYVRTLDHPGLAAERTEALARLRDWYLNQARSAVDSLTYRGGEGPPPGSPGGAAALVWLDAERANLLAAAADSDWPGHAGYVWELADTLYSYYQLRGHWADCQTIHEWALSAARESRDRVAAARIVNNLGVAYREQRQYTEAVSCFEEAIARSRQSGSRDTRVLALMNLGVTHRELGNLSQSVSCLESALSRCRRRGPSGATGLVLGNLGITLHDLGRDQDAEYAYAEAVELCRRFHDRQGESVALNNLGALHQDQGRLDEAIACFTTSLESARDAFDRIGEARALRTLGSASVARGAHDDAVKALVASADIALSVADARTHFLASRDLGDLYLRLGAGEEATRYYLRSRGAALELGDPHKSAEVEASLAALSDLDGRTGPALTHWHRAVALFRETDDRAALSSALTSSGSVLAAQGQLAEATACYEESAGIARDVKDKALELAALTGLASTTTRQGQSGDSAAIHRRIAAIHRGLSG